MNFNEKTAVVTGGSQGIGRAICLNLARKGASIVFSYIGDDAPAVETENLCKQYTDNVSYLKGNVADAGHVAELMETAKTKFGGPHILVCNAGITRDGLAMTMKEKDFDDVIDVNLKGTFLCMRAASRLMIKQRYGRIVSVSSVVGVRGNAGQANYSASKAGIIGLTKSMAKELAVRGVTVNAVAPGFIETAMTDAMPEKARDAMIATIPAARLGSPEDVAETVAFLSSEGAGYVTGQVICIDGGMAV